MKKILTDYGPLRLTGLVYFMIMFAVNLTTVLFYIVNHPLLYFKTLY